MKVVQNGKAENFAEMTHESIESPSSPRQTVGGDRRLKVRASGSNSVNFDQVYGYERINGPSTDRRTVFESRQCYHRLP